MKGVLGVFFFVLFVVIFLGLFYYTGYNKLETLKRDVNKKWSRVENIMKTKTNLVRSLVEAVNSSDNVNSTVLNRLKDITSSLLQSNTRKREIELDNELNKNISMLFVNISSIPELKGNENVEHLMGSISTTDNELIEAANSYNTAAKAYNTAISSFPYNLIASKMGLKKVPYFEVEKLTVPQPEKKKPKNKTAPPKKTTPPPITVQQT